MTKKYYLKCSIPFTPATDFLSPHQRIAKIYFNTPEEAQDLENRLRKNGISFGGGKEIFGWELKIETGEEGGEND